MSMVEQNRLSPLPAKPDSDQARVEAPVNVVEVGQWYWVKSERRKDGEDEEFEWLGCVMRIGSNHVKLESPSTQATGGYSTRVHFDDFWEILRHEPNAEAVIQGEIAHYQQLANQHLAEVKAITARLGVSGQPSLPDKAGKSSGGALVALSGQRDIKQYERALVLAKEKQLPELFKAIEHANKELTRWMTANTLPLQASVGGMKGVIEDISDRIFNVSLYAGLTEEVVSCCDGAPAAYHEKLHVMQRRLYMDEECLMGYRHGGMDFRSISEFDDWISQPENRDRIMPFPRTLVALRVRRNTKEREWDGRFASAFINITLAESDKFTFLYLRNGERVSRLSCDLEFGELIFPDRTSFDPSEPMMVKMFGGSIEKIIPRREYEAMLEEHLREEALAKQWEAENPEDTWDREKKGPRWMANPYRHSSFRDHDWRPFDPSNVYFDECAKKIADEIKQYNRIALIIQGLFDRSEVFHPHPPVKTWTQDGFAAAIELVHDGACVLYDGPKPDFEAYRAECNASLNADSVVIGQERAWLVREAEKENRRLDRDWRVRTDRRHVHFRPYGDDGPGYVAKMAQWKPRARQAVFAWLRKRRSGNYYCDESPVREAITVTADELFNVSAYKPGDFKRFFRDPRTRAEYLKWAPMLLAAEEYHAGNEKAQEPA